jgi:hypothetical protein
VRVRRRLRCSRGVRRRVRCEPRLPLVHPRLESRR